ncbi:hypothetical protein AGLY_008980 [Aphis glycines]|uniref:trypsin n=1 Tax=Aphis glycines TaxID=307491 RepID=A0A6G0TJB9_APHGL|nr:hypothetical protein AGLY_008980 [Aphis glycines]
MQKAFIVFQMVNYIVSTTATIEPSISNHDNDGLISQGKLFDIQEYPFLVFILFTHSNNIMSKCSGSLISPLFVLTAAHCTNEVDANNIIVYHYTNSKFKTRRFVEHLYQHESYDKIAFTDDISILKLENPFKYISRYIDLAGHPDEFSNATSLNCTAIGYGVTDSSENDNALGYMTSLTIMYGYEVCSDDIQNIDPWSKLICSKPSSHSVCPGDSGGPLICNGKQYGVAGFMYNTDDVNNVTCGNPHIRCGYLFVHFYSDWISNVLINTGNLIKLHNKLFNISVLLIINN